MQVQSIDEVQRLYKEALERHKEFGVITPRTVEQAVADVVAIIQKGEV
jgi:hypothetical protein